MTEPDDYPHKIGRPTRDGGARPSTTYSLRLSDEERAKLKRAHKKRKTPIATLIRNAMAADGLI